MKNIPRPDNNKESLVYLVLSDVHSKYYNQIVFEKSLKMLEAVPKKNRRCILLGDILDCEYLFKDKFFNKQVKHRQYEEYFLPEFESEILWFEMIIDQIKEVVGSYDRIFFAEGNHEERLRRPEFINDCPASMKHWFNLPLRMQFDKRGIVHIKYNDYFCMKASKSPHLYLTHGTHAGTTHAKRAHDDTRGGSIIYGHTHQRWIRPFRAMGETTYAFNNPCMCDTNPKYMNNRINNWTTGFSLIRRTCDYIFVDIIESQDDMIMDLSGMMI